MNKYTVHYAVWRTGSGFQPHDLADEKFASLKEAVGEAHLTIAQCTSLGEIQATITKPDGETIDVD